MSVSPTTLHVVVRTTLPLATLAPTIARVVHDVDPAVPVARLRDMDEVFTESIRRPRLLAQLTGAFGGLALLLAAIGTYGVLSYMVTERRREIGIRMALGADRSRVLTQVMQAWPSPRPPSASPPASPGRLVLSRLMASLLFGVQADRRGHAGGRDSDHFAGRRRRLWAAGMARVTAGPERRAQGGVALAAIALSHDAEVGSESERRNSS